MEEEDAIPSVNFVPCLKWVRRGVAVSHPVKVSHMDMEIYPNTIFYCFLEHVRFLNLVLNGL